jgi:protein-S-isoprenylcysteine O-methyltransferase Ste14
MDMLAKDGKPVIVRVGDCLFRWRNLLFPAAFLAVLFAGRPRLPAGSAQADVFLDWAGVAVALCGQIVRAAVIGLVYIRRGGKDGRVYADDLVQDGIFAHSRNPLYLGNILVFVGLFLILNSWPGWLIGFPVVLFSYWAIVRAEEHFLEAKFGAEYARYRQRVNRFWPSPCGLGATLAAHRFDWRRVIRKEYGSTFTWMTAVVLLFAWERVANGAGDAVRTDWALYLSAWLAILAAYLVARYLKKTRRLQLS